MNGWPNGRRRAAGPTCGFGRASRGRWGRARRRTPVARGVRFSVVGSLGYRAAVAAPAKRRASPRPCRTLRRIDSSGCGQPGRCARERGLSSRCSLYPKAFLDEDRRRHGGCGVVPATGRGRIDDARRDGRRGSIVASDAAAIAETTYGKVRGFVHREMFVFRGMPYGASTAGARRFMPPARPEPWTGVRSALAWGFASPQVAPEHWDKDEVAFVYEWNPGAQGEDCLRLNVWTPGLDGRKRAVMVWLHGGGFAVGSGNEMNVYDGENLARHDVVVVSLNHRIGAVGFLDLSSIGGETFAASANVGLLDIVAALEWVRENIASFGGDPGERHDLRPVGRRRQGERADGVAAGQRALPQGDRPERFHAAHADARVLGEAGRRRAEGGRRGEGPSGRPAGDAVRAPRRRGADRRQERLPHAQLLDAPRFRQSLRLQPVGPDGRRRHPARAPVPDRGARRVGRRATHRRLDAHRVRDRLT